MKSSLSMLVIAAAIATSAAHAESAKLETASVMIPSGDAGIELCLRNKHSVGMTTFMADKTLLYVHGATYPAESTFDLPIEGASMMDLIAARGYDVWLVDVRGYGCSTRPKEMSEPAADNKPIVTTEIAARDYGAAVDHKVEVLLVRIADLEARLKAGEDAARGEDKVVAHAFGARSRNVANG